MNSTRSKKENSEFKDRLCVRFVVVAHTKSIKAEDDTKFIKMMESFSKETGYSQTLLCWAIWLAEAGVKASNWETL
jgi:hypothetical protein